MQKNSLTYSIGCMLRVVFAITFLTPTSWAANGTVCLPNGFNSFSPISPNVLTLRNNISSDRLLSTQIVSDSFNNRACNSNTNAELGYVFLPTNIFVSSYSVAGFTYNTSFGIIQNTPTLVKVGGQFRTDVPNAFATANYSLFINYFVTVNCAGGLGAYTPTALEVRFTGLNSSACQGNYQVTYSYEIYQKGGVPLRSGYIKATETSGFRTRVSLYSDKAETNTVLTMIPSSNSAVFQSNIACTYSLSSTSLNLGNYSNLDIFRQSNPPVALNINTSSCTNTNGGGSNHGLYVFWSFDAADPNDSSILANTSVGSNAAVNVGARISCNNGATVARDNTAAKLSQFIITSNTFPCTAYLVPTSNVIDPNEIGAGSFSSRATLTFQFD